MRAGIVITSRINPKDCQSTLDLMKLIGLPTEGQSFSQLVSLAFSSLLETYRQSGHLPEPDPFEYMPRMQYFIGQQRSKKKIQAAKIIHTIGPNIKAPVVPNTVIQEPVKKEPQLFPQQPAGEWPEDIRELRLQFRGLYDKKNAAAGNSDIIWGKTDQAEFDRLYAIVYPGE